MTINDLESQINFQLSSKIEQLENTTSSLNANYQSLMKKYSQLKKQTELHKKTDSRNICNTSLNLNNTRNFRLLNLSVEALETSPDIHERERKKKFDNFIPPKIQFRKEVKVDDHYSKLKFENFQLKNSLDGVNKKMESLLKENDELKTETNRNTYSLKVRILLIL